MKKKLTLLIKLFLFILLTVFESYSQKIDLNKENSHETLLEELSSSKDDKFNYIVEQFDKYINENPEKVIVQIERCKFIGGAYYDYYDDYNEKEEETEKCISDIFKAYPNHPKVLIYKIQNTYGDERWKLLSGVKELIKTEPSKWSDIDASIIYEMIGNHHDENYISLINYKKAQKLNPKLDLSIKMAEIYLKQKRKSKAKEILISNLTKDTTKWVLNRKAGLLLEVDESKLALELFDEINQKDSTYINNEKMSKALIKSEKYQVARNFLLKDTIVEWGKLKKMNTLFEFDLKHSSPENAIGVYRKLQERNSNYDYFGFKRIKIAFKKIFLKWNSNDLIRVLRLLVLVFILLVLPYLWILPIYSLGKFLKSKGKFIEPKINFNWGLKQFWIISFLYSLILVFLDLGYFYDTYIDYFFDTNLSSEEELNSLQVANSVILFTALLALSTLTIVNKKNIKYLLKSNIPFFRNFSLALGFVAVNILIIKVSRVFFPIQLDLPGNLILNAKKEIIDLLQNYGFWLSCILVALIVPIYEEIIFRGVILGSVEKRIGFKAANVFQAILFSIVHFDFKMSIFYFSFGLITGFYARKTKGLFTGIVFHAVNNFIVIVLLDVSKTFLHLQQNF